MASYLLATGAAWLAASVVAFIGHKMILEGIYKTIPGPLLDETTTKRRAPLHFLARLAFAFVLVYLLRLLAPVQTSWQTGLLLGALAGLLAYVPLAFEQFARHSYPGKMIITSALIGILQSAAAGVAAAVIFSR